MYIVHMECYGVGMDMDSFFTVYSMYIVLCDYNAIDNICFECFYKYVYMIIV